MANGDDNSDKRIFSFRLHRHSPTERTALEYLLSEMERGKSIREIVSLALYRVAIEEGVSDRVLQNQQAILDKLEQLKQAGFVVDNHSGQGGTGEVRHEDPNDPLVRNLLGLDYNNLYRR